MCDTDSGEPSDSKLYFASAKAFIPAYPQPGWIDVRLRSGTTLAEVYRSVPF
jgi:hypothetical protein